MAYSIRDALKEKKKGFYIGHRLILPFKCQILKVIIDNRIFTELVGSKNLKISQDPMNTSLYFRSAGDLDDYVGTYKVIKLIVSDVDVDLTRIENHVKLICEIKENHEADIHVPSDDMLFIE